MSKLGLTFGGQSQPPDPSAPAPQEERRNSLGLSFGVKSEAEPMSAAETAASIEERQRTGGFPQGPRDGGEDLWTRTKNWFTTGKLGTVMTGDDRETNATANLPELGTEIGIREFLGPENFQTISENLGGVKKAGALLTTLDPVESIQILAEGTGGRLQVRPDEAGNMIVSLDGREAIFNKPGMTAKDWMQLGGMTAAFMPSERAATAKSILGNMARVGGTASATQAGIETLQASEGGNFNPQEVAVAGGSAAGAQGILQSVAQKIAPRLLSGGPVTKIPDSVRQEFVAAATAAGMKAEDISDNMILRAINDAADAGASGATPRQALAMEGEREFQIPLTQGQRSGDQGQLSFEDSARAGIAGNRPQETVLNWERSTQLPAVNRALDEFQGKVSGGVDGSPGDIIRQGVRDAERVADEAVTEAYDAVPDAALTPDGMNNVLRRTRQSVRGMEFDPSLPETAKVLNLVKGYEKTLKQLKGSIRPIDMQRLENMRRRINTHLGNAESSDKRQLTIMKRAFDDAIDDSIQQGLFTGDEATIEALKSARATFRQYVGKFRQNPQKGRSGKTVDQDAPGRFIEKLVEANPTDEQIVNEVFGANGVSRGSGKFMAERYRDILGPDSEGWQAIRKEALRRIFQTSKFDGRDVVSGAKTQTAFDKAMEKNESLMTTLFTQDEIGEMRRLIAAIKRTQPDLVRSRENPSGTAQKAVKNMGNAIRSATQALRFLDASMFVADGGLQLAGGMSKSAKARNAIRPFEGLRDVRPGAVSATAGGTRQQQEAN